MLQNWFSRFPDDLSRPAADVLKSMQSAGESLKDPERRDFTFVFGKFHSIQFAEAILAALRAAQMNGVADLYTGKGIDLSLDESQSFLTGLGNAQPQLKELCDELKRCGVRPRTKWQEVCGESPLPTIEDIDTHCRSEHLRRRLINATALASERVQASQSASQQAEAWAQAWEDAV